MSDARVLAEEKLDEQGGGFPWPLFLSDLIGTALLVLGGLSCVIVMNGEGSPIPKLFPDEGTRRAITGFLFGTTGALIAISGVGGTSGAHINPAVSVGFWLVGKLATGTLLIYLMGQLAGAAVGALPLLVFGQMGRSVAFGATVPGRDYGGAWRRGPYDVRHGRTALHLSGVAQAPNVHARDLPVPLQLHGVP